MAPYEALYGRPCQSPICWTEVGKRSAIGLDLVKNKVTKLNEHSFERTFT